MVVPEAVDDQFPDEVVVDQAANEVVISLDFLSNAAAMLALLGAALVEEEEAWPR